MEMLQCQFILSSLLVLNGCFYEVSCQTVYTYTSKEAELLPCTKTAGTVAVTWSNIVDESQVRVLEYSMGDPPMITISTVEKYRNFNYTMNTTSFNLVIRNVEDEDGGRYTCAPIGLDISMFAVTVEVLAKPTVKNGSKDVDELDVIVGTSYDLTCSATGARSKSDLSLVWDPPLVDKSPLIITPNGDYKDYSITSTYTAVRGVSNITCQLSGYVMQTEINDQRLENISQTVNLNVRYAPICNMTLKEREDCRNVTLTCKCEAVPADITQYTFFDGTSEIYDETNNTFTLSVAYGTLSSFSCSATNSIGPGEKSDVKVHDCDKGTTALPTTTIVTTAPMSTNEPTSTKATDATTSTMHTEDSTMVTTTEEPEEDNLNSKEPFPIWVIILIIVVVLAVVIAVIAVIMYKKGKCGSNSSSSSVTDVKVTATNSHTTNSEPAPAPVYGEIKKDRKKKSDKLDDNGAGPRGDPEIPAYGVVDKNRTKDPTPAPRSSMRDSKNPSNPKQDGLMEMQYADLDHGNKPASDEVRKPKEEPTEYATVQSVIV